MELTKALVHKYESGECTAEEKAFVEQWLHTDSLSEEEKQYIPSDNDTSLETELWSFIKPEEEKVIHLKKTNYRRLINIAAILAIISCFSIYILRQKEKSTPIETIYSSIETIKTKKGQRLTFKLSDGTQVWLNSESTLSFPKRFAAKSRRLTLVGEATFKVTKDPYRPFSVQAAGTMTQVLGTVFNLKAYENESVSLAVEEGRVSFGRLADSLGNPHYVAGQQATMSTNGVLQPIQHTRVEDFAWRQNRLIFNGEELQTVVQHINRWYGVDIQLAGSIHKEVQFTGEFKNASLDFVLERIAYVLKIQVRKEGDKITLY